MVNHFTISYGKHPSQFGVLSRPDGSKTVSAIITIHGGFWQEKYGLEENHSLVNMLIHHGYAVWNIEYRRSGNGGGWPNTFNDIHEAVNRLIHLKGKYNLDLSKVAVIGHSAGAQLAICLTNSQIGTIDIPICGIVSLAGVTDLKKMWEIHELKNLPSVVGEFMGGSPEEYKKRYEAASPMELSPVNTNLLLIHGEMDKHVPVELSIDYQKKAAEGSNKTSLAIYADCDHFTILASSSAMNFMMMRLGEWLSSIYKE